MIYCQLSLLKENKFNQRNDPFYVKPLGRIFMHFLLCIKSLFKMCQHRAHCHHTAWQEVFALIVIKEEICREGGMSQPLLLRNY